MIREAIARVIEKADLSEEDMVAVMNEIMGGEATPAQIGAFITALRMKGETIEEISGAAQVMRQKATRIATGVAVDSATSIAPSRVIAWTVISFSSTSTDTVPGVSVIELA